LLVEIGCGERRQLFTFAGVSITFKRAAPELLSMASVTSPGASEKVEGSVGWAARQMGATAKMI
jgi:hypothetical protein